MKKMFFYSAALALMISLLSGCNHDSTNSQEYWENKKANLFDFSTIDKVKIDIDYGYDGYMALFSIYAENPFTDDGHKVAGLEPIFKSYTDANSEFHSTISVPIASDKLYLYSDAIGLPWCVEMPISNNAASFKYSDLTAEELSTKVITEGTYNIGSSLYTIRANELISIYTSLSTSSSTMWKPTNSVSGIYTTLSNSTVLYNGKTVGDLLERIEKFLRYTSTETVKQNNSQFVVDESNVNLQVLDDANVEMTFLGAAGGFGNAITYYYYPSDAVMTAEDYHNLPKYVLIPRHNKFYPTSKFKIRLQYFGADYDQPGVDVFPGGVTIGWMLISDVSGFYFKDGGTGLSTNASMNQVHQRVMTALDAGRYIYSNTSANHDETPGCIALYDSATDGFVFGFEDCAFDPTFDYYDESFEDYLFYVEGNPKVNIGNYSNPKIPRLDVEIIDGELITTESVFGTLAFEDLWPSGGDYDLNDVVVEYTYKTKFNESNKVVAVDDIFTFVWDGAGLPNAFGYVVNSLLGTVDLSKSNFYSQEENNQFILCPNCKEAYNSGEMKSFNVYRSFAAAERPDKGTYQRSYNPFIVNNYVAGTHNRMEVHLPKYDGTQWMDSTLIYNPEHPFFVNKTGEYPFAIDLFSKVNWQVVTESVNIGTSGEYPQFTPWAESSGSTNKTWYLHKNN